MKYSLSVKLMLALLIVPMASVTMEEEERDLSSVSPLSSDPSRKPGDRVFVFADGTKFWNATTGAMGYTSLGLDRMMERAQERQDAEEVQRPDAEASALEQHERQAAPAVPNSVPFDSIDITYSSPGVLKTGHIHTGPIMRWQYEYEKELGLEDRRQRQWLRKKLASAFSAFSQW